MLASGFFEWFTTTHNVVQIVLMLVGGGTIVLSAWAFAWAWVRVRRSDHRSRLTSEMLQRGMNPNEIARLLLAYELTSPESMNADAETDGSPEVRLIKSMSAQDYEGSDIQRVLAAARAGGLDEQAVGIVRELSNAWADAEDMIRALETRTPATAVPDVKPGRAAVAGCA